MSLTIRAEVDADFTSWTTEEYLRAERAVTRGIAGATQSLKALWRADVASTLGVRLGNTVRSRVYPVGEPSANAAGLVYTKAPQIIAAHERGAVIRAKGGIWLAIPLPAAGKGQGGRRLTPIEWERRRGIPLRFVYRPGQPSLLVADGRQNKRGLGVESRSKTGRNRATVPIFALVPQVTLRKRLNLMQLAQTVGASLPSRIAGNWEGP